MRHRRERRTCRPPLIGDCGRAAHRQEHARGLDLTKTDLDAAAAVDQLIIEQRTLIESQPIAITSSQITDFLQAVDNITGADFQEGPPNFVPETKGQIVIDKSVNPPVLYISKDKTAASDWVQFRPAPTAVKTKFIVTTQDQLNGYITLTSTEIINSSVVAFLDRIPLFEGEGEDYEIFIAPNKDVRLVFGPNLLAENLVGEVFRITYWTP